MKGVQYLLQRITLLESEKALMLDELERIEAKVSELEKEVKNYGFTTNKEADAVTGEEA